MAMPLATSMSALHLVIDTHVLISAALSPRGAPSRLVQAVLAKQAIFFSHATFTDLETWLWKPQFDLLLEQLLQANHQLRVCTVAQALTAAI